jgi:hypothetical protein
MTTEHKLIFERIDDLLWLEWDPIGVNDIEDARGEYQSYTPQLFSLKINGAAKETIAKCLYKIETDNMGLLGNIDKCLEIADKILNT